ncbi:type II toxin-antitoxin system VapC family toxin [Methyloglobulus sp.]|uniref:type II toxin-antitoxin system VapC family toxin n=1 Tax=Methyloglobulus sp. TaxID=2518622 RepID=UPI0032B83C86
MIAVDTNIIVRLLTQDDAEQYPKALQLFASNEIFIADSVVLECEWVLRFAYHFDSVQINTALTKLFGLPNVHLTHPALLAQTLAWHSQGLDFADAFHLAFSQHCNAFYSFDKKMIKAAKNIDSCKVVLP